MTVTYRKICGVLRNCRPVTETDLPHAVQPQYYQWLKMVKTFLSLTSRSLNETLFWFNFCSAVLWKFRPKTHGCTWIFRSKISYRCIQTEPEFTIADWFTLVWNWMKLSWKHFKTVHSWNQNYSRFLIHNFSSAKFPQNFSAVKLRKRF